MTTFITKQRKVLKNFIVFEGLDGSGTTTQLDLLFNKCKAENIPCYTTCEPTENSTGKLIRKILSGEEKADPRTVAFLFAADRNEHILNTENGILHHLDSGKIVITDRYLFSSLAYQSPGCSYDFVLSLNENFPLPEHLFFIDIPVEIGQQRLSQRKGRDIYDSLDVQIKVLSTYRRAIEHFSNTAMKVHTINGTLSKEAIFEKIWQIIKTNRR